MIFLQLFAEFFKIGLFSVGGGLATLPFLYELSDKMQWFSYEDIQNMIAVSESTPGPIGVNMATYTGFTTAGPLGSVIATLGLITPSIIVILIIAGFLKRFQQNKFVIGSFNGLRPASTALIASALLGMIVMNLLNLDAFKASKAILDLFRWKNILLAVIVFIGTKKFKKWHPAVFLAFGAVYGLIFSLFAHLD